MSNWKEVLFQLVRLPDSAFQFNVSNFYNYSIALGDPSANPATVVDASTYLGTCCWWKPIKTWADPLRARAPRHRYHVLGAEKTRETFVLFHIKATNDAARLSINARQHSESERGERVCLGEQKQQDHIGFLRIIRKVRVREHKKSTLFRCTSLITQH